MLGKDKDVNYFLQYIKKLKHKEFLSLIKAMAVAIEEMNKTLLNTKKKADKFKTKRPKMKQKKKEHIGGYS